MPQRPATVSLQQATRESPILSQLMHAAAQSNARLAAVQEIIPMTLHASVFAGALDSQTWCIILGSAGTMAKIRQLLPAIELQLKQKGFPTLAIRMKIRQTQSL